ncbi:MAG: hypothetical protein COV69_02615 [Parcubacteria group bacterium CG11_big_fil_rev_8_21_14_0_20_39_14]|nr:MAG: hypothetical protein COV69_02615 [Parcubacteria group bacterium CG11_big_fil_rev_8_21_14_0_20_39_14]PIS35031.1 MAG: hypothetical protein COT36_04475 [Parcubacteria group bacterium CG08_land_8_20_14_0_20_38_56]
MPITKVSEELKDFLEKIDSEEFMPSAKDFQVSVSLRKIKAYADSEGIEFRFYQKPFGPFLKYEERRLSKDGILALTSLSFVVLLDKGVRKIILHPKKYFELILKDKKRWLKEFIFINLHEIAHLEKETMKAAMIQEGKGEVIECPYGETSCIWEEIEITKNIQDLYKKLKIRNSKEFFIRLSLKGIFVPTHQNCFEALDNDVCPLKDLIKKDEYYQSYAEPLWNRVKVERIKSEQNP